MNKFNIIHIHQIEFVISFENIIPEYDSVRLLYGYMEGIYSSRDLEKVCKMKNSQLKPAYNVQIGVDGEIYSWYRYFKLREHLELLKRTLDLEDSSRAEMLR